VAKSGTCEVATEALRRISAIYRPKREFGEFGGEDRLRMRQAVTRPQWQELHVWLQLERTRVPEGGATAKALSTA
jgi:transposase